MKPDFRSKRSPSRAIAGPVLVCLINAPLIRAQSPVDPPSATPPSFEVASVKPNNSGTRNSSTTNYGKRVNATNVTLQQYLRWAYGVTRYQIVGPDWLGSERYDINAESLERPNEEQLQRMLQALLADRFKLKLHCEQRVLPVYELVVGKNGAKLQPAEGSGSSSTNSGRGSIGAQQSTMAHFAEVLTRQLDRPVLDKTELQGTYDLKLEWMPEDKRMSAPDPAARDTTADDTGPSIFTAIQEQLGLKLEARKASVDVFVIDHVEKIPTEN